MTRSRHHHFPVADRPRRDRMHTAAAALAARWKAEDDAPAGLLAAMHAVGDAPPEAAIAALASWLGDARWLKGRLEQALDLLAADSFARPPLRPVGGGALGGILLAEAGPIRITLLIRPFEAGEAGDAPLALFAPGRTCLRILSAGGAAVHFHRVSVSAAEEAGAFTAAAASRCVTAPPRALVMGEILALDTAREAISLTGGNGDVLMLEIAVQPPSPLPVRAYDVASGRLAHVSASRRDSSFRGMALALLRTLGRTDAAPLFAAETQSEDFAARWNAMRELVALDPAAAHPHLARMAASDPHPEIRRAAKATLALYAREPAPCPA
ncbi:HEAT repeat domain-containing protein [Sphingopyxis panaciterrae]